MNAKEVEKHTNKIIKVPISTELLIKRVLMNELGRLLVSNHASE